MHTTFKFVMDQLVGDITYQYLLEDKLIVI